MSIKYDGRTRLAGSPYSSVVSMWGRRTVVAGVAQRGNISVGAGVSATATITSVDINNSELRRTGQNPAGGGAQTDRMMMGSLTFTNSTTVTATVDTISGSTGTDQGYEVMPYVPGYLKQVQRGTVAGNATATITAVDPNRTTIDDLGCTCTAGNFNIAGGYYLKLTSATVITPTSTYGAFVSIRYQAAERF